MHNTHQFKTIREETKTNNLSEHALRLMQKQGKIPHIMCGQKCLINYPLLLEQLTDESRRNAKGGDSY